ncbi:MAG: translation initiation factor IF-3 [Candidatus Poribacteria bacterium]|nr:translation initiation factor IF-3 [Candidatus Poribacteria bacterium]
MRINDAIRAREVRVIDGDGTQLGIMDPEEAIRIASGKNLDLVEVAPDAKPPVCRIMNYSKYRYEQEKKARQARKAQKNIEIKEIRLKPNMAGHDLEYRVRHAEEFLEDGNKVRATVRFFGRQIIHTQLGHELLSQFAQMLGEKAVIENSPRMEGRQMSILLAPANEARSS